MGRQGKENQPANSAEEEKEENGVNSGSRGQTTGPMAKQGFYGIFTRELLVPCFVLGVFCRKETDFRTLCG